MTLANTIKFIWCHPLNVGRQTQALMRFARWQIGSRILGAPTVWPFVNGARLIVQTGMRAATGNIYVGLLEFEQMSLVLHYLRPADRFIDIGANVGTYTVLAAGVVGAEVVSVEPVPSTFKCLMDNINLNGIGNLVDARNVGIGRRRERLVFSVDMGAANHVVSNPGYGGQCIVDGYSLDELAGDLRPEMIKIDVEGFEHEVLAGGQKVFANPSLNVVFMELRGHGRRYGFDERAVDATLRDLGFGAYLYDPLARSIDARRQDDESLGDMVYIRDVSRARDRVAASPTYRIGGRSL
jgi:FkbM family methyltransferase